MGGNPNPTVGQIYGGYPGVGGFSYGTGYGYGYRWWKTISTNLSNICF